MIAADALRVAREDFAQACGTRAPVRMSPQQLRVYIRAIIRLVPLVAKAERKALQRYLSGARQLQRDQAREAMSEIYDNVRHYERGTSV